MNDTAFELLQVNHEALKFISYFIELGRKSHTHFHFKSAERKVQLFLPRSVLLTVCV